MVIGVLTLDFSIDGAFSLKEKRMTVNRIRDRVRNKFNVAVAEVDDHELWNRACIAVVAVSTEQKHVNQMLSRVKSGDQAWAGASDAVAESAPDQMLSRVKARDKVWAGDLDVVVDIYRM